MIETNSSARNLWTLLSPIEQAVNRLLVSDEDASQEVYALDGKTILLSITGLNLEIYLTFRNGRVSLAKECPNKEFGEGPVKVDVQLSGKIKDFLALAKNQREGESVSAGQVDIQGDLATAQRVQNLFRNMHIDVEELVAKATNDAFAYRLGQVARKGFGFIRDGLKGIEQDVGSYVLYEKRVTPSRQELIDFTSDVDDIVLRVDRLDSRLQQLKRQRAAVSNDAGNAASPGQTVSNLNLHTDSLRSRDKE